MEETVVDGLISEFYEVNENEETPQLGGGNKETTPIPTPIGTCSDGVSI